MKLHFIFPAQIVALVFCITCFDFTFAQSIFPSGQQAFSVQMHIHGLSHHNGSSKPGSMQWHNFYADSLKLNSIWWSDHSQFFDQFNVRYFTFTNGYLDSANNILGLSGSIDTPDSWQASSNGGIENTSLTDSSITMSFQSTINNASYQYFAYNPRGISGLLKSVNGLTKPLTADPLLSFKLTASGLNTLDKTHVQLILHLSWHKNPAENQQTIIYNFVHNSLGNSTQLKGADTVVVNIPVYNGIKTNVLLHPAIDAALLTNGADNTISDYELRVEANYTSGVLAKFEHMHIYSNDSTGNINYNNIKSIANNYSNLYQIKQFIGLEFSAEHNVFKHINGFYPDTAILINQFLDSSNNNNDPELFVKHIHNMNGVASYNHPFGTQHGPLDSTVVQDFRTDTIFNNLVNNHVYNCDIMEVGYYIRGHSDLEHHLELWDMLTAKGIYLYGNGTNDSHGNSWDEYNKMVTWIWASSPKPDSLIASIKKGRMYFGNIFNWTGDCYFKIGNSEMGDRTNSDCMKEYFKGSITSLPPNSKVKITQALIDTSSSTVTYLLKDVLIDITDSILLDLTKPSFVRLTAYDVNDVPIVCSNPIVFINFNNTICLSAEPEIYNSNNENSILLYPNPSINIIKAEIKISSSQNLQMDILNAEGKELTHIDQGILHKGKHVFPVDISKLPESIYFIRFSSDKTNSTLRFIKTN